MKFDRFISKILLETLYHPDTFGKSSYTKDPETALKALSDAYTFLKDYNVARYDHSLAGGLNPEDKKICDAVETITVVMRDSNLNTFKVGQEEMDKVQLAKNVIKLASRFGQKTFPDTPKIALDVETTRKIRTPKGPYYAPTSEYNDMDGNPIEQGTELSGSDYRLSAFVDAKNIKNHGGIPKIHECYLYLFTVAGIRWQPYRRSSKGVERLQNIQDVEEYPVYWWGENSLPYRTLLSVLDNIVRRVPRPGEDENPDPRGGIQWSSDQVSGKKKARPYSTIGDKKIVGAAHGDEIEGIMNFGKSIDEIKNQIESEDFEPIRAEKKQIEELTEKARQGNQEALQMLKDAKDRQLAYQELIDNGNWQEIVRIYKDRLSKYWSVYDGEFKKNARRPFLGKQTEPEDAWPYFHMFIKNPANNRYRCLPVSAKQKYEFLYPRNITEIANIFYKDKVVD